MIGATTNCPLRCSGIALPVTHVMSAELEIYRSRENGYAAGIGDTSLQPAILLLFLTKDSQMALGVKLGWRVNTPHTDFLFAFARLRDVVGGLHSHQRVHLHAKSFLDA